MFFGDAGEKTCQLFVLIVMLLFASLSAHFLEDSFELLSEHYVIFSDGHFRHTCYSSLNH